ncbi:amino acid permease C-terminal domain-containing protein [Desulfosporosinus orientis]
MPLVSLLAVALDFYLLANLDHTTWVRYAIWMLIIYLTRSHLSCS